MASEFEFHSIKEALARVENFEFLLLSENEPNGRLIAELQEVDGYWIGMACSINRYSSQFNVNSDNFAKIEADFVKLEASPDFTALLTPRR